MLLFRFSLLFLRRRYILKLQNNERVMGVKRTMIVARAKLGRAATR
jgi:hypothetical protein